MEGRFLVDDEEPAFVVLAHRAERDVRMNLLAVKVEAAKSEAPKPK